VRLLLTAVVVLTVALLGISGSAQSVRTMAYDHIHLAVPDPDKAYEWYVKNLDGQAGENPGRVIFEPFTGKRPLPVQLIFLRAADAKASEGSVIDSIGFSVADVAAKTKALETAGAKVVAAGVVVDPWGTKIELVNDVPGRGFHHVTLKVADPDATLRWFTSNFGGARTKMGGRDAVRYDRTYLVVTKGEGAAPSQGRSIDHLGFGPRSMDGEETALKSAGVKFTSEPSPMPNQFGHRTAYVEAPGGIRIELVEHATCAWGKAPDNPLAVLFRESVAPVRNLERPVGAR
jgi:catechol 2,3-dioxygenase-like lactoylglutathione lyase family enzyme